MINDVSRLVAWWFIFAGVVAIAGLVVLILIVLVGHRPRDR